MTYVPDLSVFADGEVTFSFWAVDQAGNTGEEAQIVLMKDSTCPVITGRLDTKGRRVGDFYSDSCQVSIFVQDENIWTSAGITSGIDLALHMINRLCGPE